MVLWYTYDRESSYKKMFPEFVFEDLFRVGLILIDSCYWGVEQCHFVTESKFLDFLTIWLLWVEGLLSFVVKCV